MARNAVTPFRSTLMVLVAVVALSTLQSCSLMLDFDECASDEDCTSTGQCVNQVCQEINRESVSSFIVDDTTWTADTVYVLEELIFVIAPATLTIEPGTTILGEKDSALITQAGAKLEAEGTRDAPIVFTSAQPEGRRRAGDWGGLALIGQAEINRPDMTLRIREDEDEDRVGGTDDTSSCGTLKYVRSEFGGGLVDGQKALNGITFAACGSGTEVDYIQAHLGDDDGIEIFGGTMDIRHAVASRPQGDGFDLDVGWRGTGQFLAVQMDVRGEEAFEIENRGEEPTAEPQTDAQIYNYTIIGAEDSTDLQRGVIFKSGGLSLLSHGIVMGTDTTGVHIEGTESGEHAASEDILIHDTLFYDVGPDGTEPFTIDEDAAASEFDPDTFFGDDAFNNLFGEDPGIESPYDLGNPSWKPTAEHTTGIDAPPEGFDLTAVYRGAFSPSADPWTEGWTAYPKN
ncbi:MAG: hypothetical protein ACLFVJ_10385 [Persicimonas sp.]